MLVGMEVAAVGEGGMEIAWSLLGGLFDGDVLWGWYCLRIKIGEIAVVDTWRIWVWVWVRNWEEGRTGLGGLDRAECGLRGGDEAGI